MKKKVNYEFEVSVSIECYSHKPNAADYQQMKFQKESLTIQEFVKKITLGHSFCHIYRGNKRTTANFLYTHCMCIDVDDVATPMSKFIDSLAAFLPTIAYTTFSNGEDETYSYRLVYCFETPVSQEFETLYFAICYAINLLDNKDHCGRIKAQLMNGNSLSSVEVFQSNIVYSISDFMEKNNRDSFETLCLASTVTIPAPNKSDALCSQEKDEKVIAEFRRSKKVFFDRCFATVEIVRESRLQYNDQGYCLLDENYLKLFDRVQWKGNVSTIKPFRDGESRRKRLYIDGCIIRRIKPNITFRELLFNLCFRREHYYDNSDGVLSDGLLIAKTKDIMGKNLTDLEFLKTTKHGKFKTDPTFCKANDINRRSYSRKVAKMINHESIGEWYNCSLSVSDNLQWA